MPAITLPADGDKPYGAVLRTAITSINTAVDDINAAWVAYTPTFTNFTLGNGSVVARYKQIGKTVLAYLFITLGSTSSVGNNPIFTTPTSMKSGGSGLFFPANYTIAGVEYLGAAIGFDQTQLLLGTQQVSGTSVVRGTVTATAPATWASGDKIGLEFFYEAA